MSGPLRWCPPLYIIGYNANTSRLLLAHFVSILSLITIAVADSGHAPRSPNLRTQRRLSRSQACRHVGTGLNPSFRKKYDSAVCWINVRCCPISAKAGSDPKRTFTTA